MNAPESAIKIKSAIVAVFTFCSALWGWLGWVVMVFGFCLAFDFITGVWAAKRNGEIDSTVARDGCWHKLGEIVALIVAACLDITINLILHMEALGTVIPVTLPSKIPFFFTLLVAIWYIITELISIIENAAKLGAPVPEWLNKFMLRLKDNTDKAVEPHQKE